MKICEYILCINHVLIKPFSDDEEMDVQGEASDGGRGDEADDEGEAAE